jgi:hypothetical protein
MNDETARDIAAELLASDADTAGFSPQEINTLHGRLVQVLTLVPEPERWAVLHSGEGRPEALMLAEDFLFRAPLAFAPGELPTVILESRRVAEIAAVSLDWGEREQTAHGPGYRPTWSFRFNEGEPLVVDGTAVIDPPWEDRAEEFARALAGRVGWVA